MGRYRNRPGPLAGYLVVAFGTVWLLGGTLSQAKPKANRSGSPANQTAWAKPDKAKYPSVGEVTVERLYVRAGPGTNYYVCGLLGQGSKVVVHKESHGWLKIDPPKGSFSLIASAYVQRLDNDQGLVAADVVRVRAGPSQSKRISAVQCKLNKGDRVIILGKMSLQIEGNKENFYKIEPPAGQAFFWTSAKYVAYVGPYKKRFDTEEVVEPIEEPFEIPETIDPAEVPALDERAKLKAMDQALQMEMRRPIAQRQLAEHLAKYLSVANESSSASAQNLISIRVGEIRRQMRIQEDLRRLAEIKAKYKSSQERMKALERIHRQAVVQAGEKHKELTGQLEPSHAYASRGAERWRLVNPFTGKNICYLLPGSVTVEQLRKKEGEIVTISGPAVHDLRLRLDLIVANKMQADES